MSDYSIVEEALKFIGAGYAYDTATGEIFSPGREEAEKISPGGLSYAHKRPKGDKVPASVKIWGEGNLLKATREGPFEAPGGGKRGQVIGLSRSARRHMMYRLCEVKRSSAPLFVTLTYPDLYDKNPRRWKRDLKTFFQRLKRDYPGSSAFWRLELKRRISGNSQGQIAPHFHLLTWGVSFLHMLNFIKVAWWQVVGSGNEDHYKAGTNVQVVRTENGVKRYAAKYASKNEDEENLFVEVQKVGAVGRLWGIFNRPGIPWADCETIITSNEEVYKLLRLMRRYSHLKMRAKTPSMTLMVNDPSQWKRPLRC